MGSSEGIPLLNKKVSKKRNENTKTPSESADQDGSLDSLECCNKYPRCSKNESCRLRDRCNGTFQKTNSCRRTISRSKPERRINSSLGITEVPRFKTLGVPLVGMHNACGLPVFAHWQSSRMRSLREHDTQSRNQDKVQSRNQDKTPSRNQDKTSRNRDKTLPRNQDKTLPRNLDKTLSRNQDKTLCRNQDKTHLKKFSTRSRRNSKEADFKSEWIMIRETNRPVSSASCKRRSFKVAKVGSLSTRKVLKAGRDNSEKESIICRFGGSFGRRSGKRTTLYAKNGGDEAVTALKTLCLNPLARNSRGDVMIW